LQIEISDQTDMVQSSRSNLHLHLNWMVNCIQHTTTARVASVCTKSRIHIRKQVVITKQSIQPCLGNTYNFLS